MTLGGPEVMERLGENERRWKEKSIEKLKPFLDLVVSKVKGMKLESMQGSALFDVYAPINESMKVVGGIIATDKNEVPLQGIVYVDFIHMLEIISGKLEALHAALLKKPNDFQTAVEDLVDDIEMISNHLSDDPMSTEESDAEKVAA